MNTPPIPRTEDRDFKVWEYQVSHGQLLLRSPKSPGSSSSPERTTNVDIVFLDVEFMSLPCLLRGLTMALPTADEINAVDSLLGKTIEPGDIRVIVSGGKRFFVVAWSVSITENDGDIFESPFEFRSHFRSPGR